MPVLGANDPNVTDQFTFEFVSGDGDADNERFEIVEGELRSRSPLDFETGPTTFSIRLRATDPFGESVEQSFTITLINDGENPPVAIDDGITINIGQSGNLEIVDDNDTDADFNTLTVIAVNESSDLVHQAFSLPSGIEVTVQDDGFTQINTFPAMSYYASLLPGDEDTESFSYTVDDGFGNTDSATVTITIVGRDDPPEPQEDRGTRRPGQAVEIEKSLLLRNDHDPEGGPLTVFVGEGGGQQQQPGGGDYVETFLGGMVVDDGDIIIYSPPDPDHGERVWFDDSE